MGHVCSRCHGSRPVALASRRILRTIKRGGRRSVPGRSGDKVIIGKLCSITIRFDGYYDPIPKSRVIKFIAHKHNISVRHASYIGVLRLSSVRHIHLVRTR